MNFSKDPYVSICSVWSYMALAMIMILYYNADLRHSQLRIWDELNFAWIAHAFGWLHTQVLTQTSFIIMSNKGRLPASGLGAKCPEQHIPFARLHKHIAICSFSLSLSLSLDHSLFLFPSPSEPTSTSQPEVCDECFYCARRYPTPSRGQVPGGGPQSAVDGADEAGELPTRCHPTPSRGQVQECDGAERLSQQH